MTKKTKSEKGSAWSIILLFFGMLALLFWWGASLDDTPVTIDERNEAVLVLSDVPLEMSYRCFDNDQYQYVINETTYSVTHPKEHRTVRIDTENTKFRVIHPLYRYYQYDFWETSHFKQQVENRSDYGNWECTVRVDHQLNATIYDEGYEEQLSHTLHERFDFVCRWSPGEKVRCEERPYRNNFEEFLWHFPEDNIKEELFYRGE